MIGLPSGNSGEIDVIKDMRFDSFHIRNLVRRRHKGNLFERWVDIDLLCNSNTYNPIC